MSRLNRAPVKNDNALEGRSCCEWSTFKHGFLEFWSRWFDAPPTAKHWNSAMRDWRAGNTGPEAAHNAQRRAKERVAREIGQLIDIEPPHRRNQ